MHAAALSTDGHARLPLRRTPLLLGVPKVRRLFRVAKSLIDCTELPTQTNYMTCNVEDPFPLLPSPYNNNNNTIPVHDEQSKDRRTWVTYTLKACRRHTCLRINSHKAKPQGSSLEDPTLPTSPRESQVIRHPPSTSGRRRWADQPERGRHSLHCPSSMSVHIGRPPRWAEQ